MAATKSAVKKKAVKATPSDKKERTTAVKAKVKMTIADLEVPLRKVSNSVSSVQSYLKVKDVKSFKKEVAALAGRVAKLNEAAEFL